MLAPMDGNGLYGMEEGERGIIGASFGDQK